MDDWLYVLFVPAGMTLAFAYTAAETALFSLPRDALERMRDSDHPAARKIPALLSDSRKLFLTTATGFSLGSVLCVATALVLVERYVQSWQGGSWITLAGGLAVTALWLMVGVLLPKLIATAHAEKTALRFASFIATSEFLLMPFSFPVGIMARIITRVLKIERERYGLTYSQIDALVETTTTGQHTEVSATEREMIRAVMEFGDTTAREIMVPRIDLVALDIETPLEAAIDKVLESKHSRIPIFTETIDHVNGILYAKELLGTLKPGTTLRSLVRPAFFVPENKHVDELLREFQKQRLHIAVVVDEYGGTAGVVTLEDILEEIIGEIQDEYDEETPSITAIDDNAWLAEARVLADDLNELVNEPVVPDSGDYDSLGGYLYASTGRVPDAGEMITLGNWKFTVVKRTGNRLITVRIDRVPTPAEESDAVVQ